DQNHFSTVFNQMSRCSSTQTRGTTGDHNNFSLNVHVYFLAIFLFQIRLNMQSKQSFYSVQFPNIASCMMYLDNENEDIRLNMHKPALEYSKGTISIDL